VLVVTGGSPQELTVVVKLQPIGLETPAPSNFADLPSRISMESKSLTDQSHRRRIFSVAFNVQFFNAVTEFQCSSHSISKTR